jgi:RNA polymerase sigma-70 factor (ECF subfamily)
VDDLSLAYQPGEAVTEDVTATEEYAWVQRAQVGDMEAFDLIMIRYESRLLRFLTGLVSDVETARDLCQDTFLSAYEALPRLKGELHLSAWLHAIARNHVRSYYRRQALRTLLPLSDESIPARVADVQETTVAQDTLNRALKRLPHKYANPLLLQVASGLSCREISEVLGCSEGAVKVRLLRAREALRRLYEEESCK